MRKILVLGLLAMRSDISRPEQSTVAANPKFWTVKEVASATPAEKSKGKKKRTLEPAALKQSAPSLSPSRSGNSLSRKPRLVQYPRVPTVAG